MIARRHGLGGAAHVALHLARQAHPRSEEYDRLDQRLAQSPGKVAVERVKILYGIACIAPEELVAAVPAEEGVDAVAGGKARAIVCRNR
jgi:hypothetical protein